jgi:hypothetical protein
MSGRRISMLALATALCGCQTASAQSYDPPGRIGRVSDVTGSVSLLPVGETNWSTAALNYPLTTGDALWADVDSRAEVHVGASAVRLAPGTSLSFDAIQDNLIQLRIGQGSVQVRLRELAQDESYEVDTPGGAVLLHEAGSYRFDVTPDGQRTTITVRDGDADVQVGNDTYPLRRSSSVTLTGNGAPPIASGGMMAPDAWESWADARDRREDARPATRYVSRDMVGYEDLDDYGDWQVDASYGPVWYPRSVSSDWAPYRTGRWEWVQPWGWTWIDESPWGFAPFHYGRWANQGGRWGWYPGTERMRPVYAPALVAFVSGDNWNVSLSFGSGGGVGWVPLGPNEMYVPAYRASPTYVRNVNVTNVNVTNINVTNVDINRVQYVNRNVPGAVTAVPRDAFEGSRPVGRAAVRVRPADLAAVRVSAAPVAAGTPIATPRPGAPRDRGRPDNVGPIRQPPAEVARVATPARPPRAAQRAPVPAAPTGQQDRGRVNVNQPAVTPPPTEPAVSKPATPATPPGRARNQPTQPAPRAVAPTPATPTAQPGRARNQPRQPAPTPAVPAPATPTIPPGRTRNQPTQPAPTPAVPTPAAPATPPGRARNQPRQPAPTPAVPAPATPTIPPGRTRNQPTQPAARPTTPPGRGRATPADTSRGRKPPKTKPDSGQGGSSPSIQYAVQQ